MFKKVCFGTAFVLAIAMGVAHSANWPATPPVVQATGNTVISNADLGTQKTGSVTNDDRPTSTTGGLAITIEPNGTATGITISANNINVSGYNSTITTTRGGSGTFTYGSGIATGTFGLYGINTDRTKGINNTNFNSVNFSGNTTKFIVADLHTADYPSAFGGAADLASAGALNYRNSTISNNSLIMDVNNTAAVGPHVNGGGVALRDQFTADHTLSALTFSNNTVTLNSTNGITGGTARGGALFVQNTNDENTDVGMSGQTAVDQEATDLYIANSSFIGNKAVNNIGGLAQGGAVALDMGVMAEMDSVSFTGNAAVATTGAAQGGALHINLRNSLAAIGSGSSFVGATNPISTSGGYSYHTQITNSEFKNNYAEGATAQGGAIWTSSGLYVSGTTFQGNYTTDGTTRTANAIHLANPVTAGADWNQLTNNNSKTTVIFADAAGSASYDYDGISSDNVNARIAKTGAGDLHLYGNYDKFLGDEIDLQSGNTYFSGGQTFANAVMRLGNGASANLGDATVNRNVKVDTLNIGTGSAITAKAYAGDNGVFGNSAYFEADSLSGSVANTSNSYRITGMMNQNLKYMIAGNITTVPGVNPGTAHETIDGLYGKYNVYTDTNAIWAEANGPMRTLGSYGSSRSARSVGNYIGRQGGTLRDYLEANYTSANAGRIDHLLAMASGEGHAAVNGAAAAFGRNSMVNIANQAMNGWAGSFYGPGVYDSASSRRRAIASTRAYGVSSLDCPGPTTRVWANIDGFYLDGDDDDSFKAEPAAGACPSGPTG